MSRSVNCSVRADIAGCMASTATPICNPRSIFFKAGDSLRQPWHTDRMGLMLRRMLSPILARLGSRTILGIGGTLFLLNMIIPDPLPLVDEFLILAGTILLSRWAEPGAKGASDARGASGATGASEATGASSATGAWGAGTPTGPKHVGRSSTAR